MGRLRDGFENPLFQHYGSEIVDLYGNDDMILFRYDEEASKENIDPLWKEYAPNAKYVGYKVKGFLTEFTRETSTASPHGKDTEFDAKVTISREHLDKSGVPKDIDGQMVREGDILLINELGDAYYFDLLNVERKGYVNQSDQWLFLDLTCKRREKYVPERKLL